ncbi:MAG: substrate-binding domain-containing protein [Actinobacteria bacterium]|nr:substrate-binding domain-containing protein [Actinomycetota bacterium]
MKMKRILFFMLIAVIAVTFSIAGISCKKSGATETSVAATETTAGETKAESESATAGETKSTAEKKHSFVMIVHDVSSAFSAEFNRGATDASKLLSVDFKYMGTTGIDIPKQVSMFENAVEGGYDGVMVTIFDQKAFERGLQKAKEKGVAVVSFNIDGDWGQRATLGYVGGNMFNEGKEIGDYFFKEVMKGKGSYVLLPAIADLLVLIQRADGIKEAQKKYPDIKYLGEVEIGTDLTKAAAACENAYTKYPEATAMIGTDHFSEGLANFIVSRKLEGKLLGGGFDITPGMLKAIKLGAIQTTIGQNPYLQGFYSAMQLWLYLEKDIHPIEIDSGRELVTTENVDYYMKKYNVTME